MLYSLKTLFGIESIDALPALLFSDEALMQLVGFHAQQVRDGVRQRGAAKRYGERHPGPICPDTLAKNIVKWNLQDLEMVFNGASRALAQAGVFGKKVTGMADGTDWETTARNRGCGRVTRKVRMEDKHGQKHEIDVTVYGTAETVRELLRRLADAYVGIPMSIILDNARYQRCTRAQAVAQALGIELLFVPSSSPNLNLIERLWRFVKKQ